MNLTDLKFEVFQEEVDGYVVARWTVYDSVTGKCVKLDKSLLRYFVTLLTQCAQQIAMTNDITELSKTVQFSIDNVNMDGMGASQNKTKDLNKDS